MSYASANTSPRVILRDTIRSTGVRSVVLENIWHEDTIEDGGPTFPEVIHAEALNGREQHLGPTNHDLILKAWKRYDPDAAVELPVRVVVYPGFALEPLGEGACPGCDGTGEGPEPDDGMDDREWCLACHGRGVVYVARDVIGGAA